MNLQDRMHLNENEPVTNDTLIMALNNFFTEKLAFLEEIVEDNKAMETQLQELNDRMDEIE